MNESKSAGNGSFLTRELARISMLHMLQVDMRDHSQDGLQAKSSKIRVVRFGWIRAPVDISREDNPKINVRTEVSLGRV